MLISVKKFPICNCNLISSNSQNIKISFFCHWDSRCHLGALHSPNLIIAPKWKPQPPQIPLLHSGASHLSFSRQFDVWKSGPFDGTPRAPAAKPNLLQSVNVLGSTSGKPSPSLTCSPPPVLRLYPNSSVCPSRSHFVFVDVTEICFPFKCQRGM